MDINKIFNLFPEQSSSNSSLNFEDHPLYFIKMFVKILQKQDKLIEVFQNLSNDTSKNNQTLNNEEELAEYVSNMRAFHYLEKLDLSNPTHIDIIISNSSKELFSLLNYSIKFFENLEQYEKCSFLKKVQDLIK